MYKELLHNKVFLTLSVFFISIIFLNRCIQKDSDQKKEVSVVDQYSKYAGSESCKSCHQSIYESHLKTFHNQTSSIASGQTIKGNFETGKNRFYFKPSLYVAAEKRDSGYFQAAYKDDAEKIARRFDFVVGSGKRGQTFLYWHDQYIFQLPLMYFTEYNEWTNSPGYSNKVEFNRPITARCLECHSTYFHQQDEPNAKADEFSKTNFILSVGCEKCHGPAAEHVSYHQKNPVEKNAKYIINPARLSREQNLDLCRSCHGGRLNKTKPSFSFLPGDKLSDYFNLDSTVTDVTEIDVHGNQYGMLSASKCFKSSAMTCTTCHNAHTNESKNLVSFADKCITCHQPGNKVGCKLYDGTNENFLRTNCVDCHMPEEASKAIMVLREGETIPTSAKMRSHFISIYDDAYKRIVSKQKK